MQADERALDAIEAPEPLRIAVREIHGNFGKQIDSLVSQGPVMRLTPEMGRASSDVWTAAEGERRAAIDSLFGPESAKEFQHAERTALGSHYRRRWSPILTAGMTFPLAPAGEDQ